MSNIMFKRIFIIIIIVLFIESLITTNFAIAENTPASLDMKILSSQTLSGVAGDYVTVKASIQNISLQTINNVTTYLSLVDEETKLPVDLEDWSAEKGLFIGTIDSRQTLPLDWKIHFVKAGKYSLIIVAEIYGGNYPQTSGIVHFAVAPKQNLNPSHVLPVALITPIVILCLMILLTYRRNSKIT